ncbi:MAG: S41 family peptidase [Candidatus Aminicenantes bacterium]
MKRRLVLSILLILILIIVPSWDEDIWNQSLQKTSSIVSLVEENYYRDINREELIYSSIEGLLHTLDPHSYFLDPDHFHRLRESHTGKYYGLGIMIQKQEERLVVISPIEGTPAYRMGIQAGDVISHINGESTKPISSFEAMQRLRGQKGTKVTITITREGLEKPFDLTIVREEISLQSVPYAFIFQDGVGYIFIRNFSSTTTKEFEEKMESLIQQGMEKLILDLRGNGGGTFAQSVEIADEFLPKGALVVSIKGRNPYYNGEYSARRSNQYEDIPLVVLIDRGSASAPEIVSGAIKDNDRGFIVGENSFGKGLVQTVFRLGPDIAMALTTAKYFTPSGRSIQRDYSSLEDYLLSKDIPQEEREVRYTSKGRKVLGQGGISPDFEMDFSFHNLTSTLLLKGAFFRYGRNFAAKKTPLSKDMIFPSEKKTSPAAWEEKETVDKDLAVDSRIIQDFKHYLKENEISCSPQQFEDSLKEIKRELKREIFSSLWGIEEGIKAYRESDPVVLKALQVLPEAEKLIKGPSS